MAELAVALHCSPQHLLELEGDWLLTLIDVLTERNT